MKLLLLLLLGWAHLGCGTVLGHQDRIITLKDGKLAELPEPYQPATFAADKFVLRIGKHELPFTPFLTGLFPPDGKYALNLSASWYHDRALLPPYLTMEIAPAGLRLSHRILFNLDTLEVLKVSKRVTKGNTMTELPVELTEVQQHAIKRAVREVAPAK